MFEHSLWKSRSHAKQPMWFLLAPMFLFLIAIPFCIHFFGIGLIFGLDVGIFLILLVVVMVIGRKFRWNNSKLLFAVGYDGIFFTTVNTNNGSYFQEDLHNIKGYTSVTDGVYATVTVYFHEKANAGMFGNIDCLKMIKIENFDQLQEAFKTLGIEPLSN